MVFDTVSFNIVEVLKISPSANVFVLGNLSLYHKDLLIYTGRTDRPGELCYNFSISNDLTQMFNFPTLACCNIFLIYFFFITEGFDIASYANGNTPYVSANNMNGAVKSLEENSTKLFKWFSDNLLESNVNKCHLLVSTNNTINIRVENFVIKNSDCEKFLGVKFDSKLTFNSQISDLCKKARKNVHSLTRATLYMNISKRSIIMNTFLKSQWSYWCLVWMCHSRANHSKINRLH